MRVFEYYVEETLAETVKAIVKKTKQHAVRHSGGIDIEGSIMATLIGWHSNSEVNRAIGIDYGSTLSDRIRSWYCTGSHREPVSESPLIDRL